MSKLVTPAFLAGAVLAAVSSVFAEPPAPPKGGQDQRIVVKTADDLPRHTYQISGKPSEFLLSDKPFKEFLAQVKANAEADLAKYKIEDPTTLQGYYQVLQQVAMLEGRESDAVTYIDKIRALESKESKKLTTGLVLRALVTAKASAGGDKDKFTAEFKKNLSSALSALPWDKVRESITQAKGYAEILSRDLIIGAMQGQLDPVVEQSKGELSGDLAGGLIGARVALDVILPLNPAIIEVYGKAMEGRTSARKDIWSERQVVLKPSEPGVPIVVAIWDSGVDTSIFGDRIWTNPKEVVNGKDDDNNGFIDDIHGIAFDLRSNHTTDLVLPLTGLRTDKTVAASYTKGLLDLQANVESPDSVNLRQHVVDMKPDDVTPFMEDLTLFSQYAHGTHVAGIAAEGNPFIRIMTVRITFEFRAFPEFAPSVEQAEKEARAAADAVAYMRGAGVRVANMSWGGSRKDIEDQLEKKRKDIEEQAQKKDPTSASEARAELARKIFKVQRDGQETALKSAPEILFVVAAGNSDNDNQFGEFIPSGLNLPNMITIGAVDQSGKPTSFTTFGKNVSLYANGLEVESAIPGGQRMKFSGTSMAAPNVTNLAAKLLAMNPKLTTPEVIDLITKGADPMEGYPGRFVINPKKSLELLKK